MLRPVLSVLLVCVFSVYADDDHGENAPSYTESEFGARVEESAHFVMFFAPWCGHCKRLAPTWDELALKHQQLEDSQVTIAKVDCTQETPLCSAHGVGGYPTLKFFQKGSTEGLKYKGQRSVDKFEEFMNEQLAIQEEADNPQAPAPKTSLVELTVDNYESTIKFGHVFVKFFAPWCGHCQRLAPTWDMLAETFQHDDTVQIAKVDCTQHKTLCDQNDVKGYPTLLFFTNGQAVDKYKGPRSIDNLKTYVSEKMAEQNVNAQRTDEQIPEPQVEPPKPASAVVDLNADTFEEGVSTGISFVKFYAPWCGHCRRLAPTWEDLATKTQPLTSVKIAKVNCDEHKPLCREKGVQGYPTLMLFKNGINVQEYSGGRGFEELHQFVMDNMPHEEL